MMQNIKLWAVKHFIIAGLVISLIYNGIAVGMLRGINWGSNPIFSPPQLMLLPGSMVGFIPLMAGFGFCDSQIGYFSQCSVPENIAPTCPDMETRLMACVEKWSVTDVYENHSQWIVVGMNTIIFWLLAVLLLRIWGGMEKPRHRAT